MQIRPIAYWQRCRYRSLIGSILLSVSIPISFQTERDRLAAMCKELRDAEGPQLVDPKLSGLLDAWDAGDGVVRRELLATLFSDIHIRQSRVVG